MEETCSLESTLPRSKTGGKTTSAWTFSRAHIGDGIQFQLFLMFCFSILEQVSPRCGLPSQFQRSSRQCVCGQKMCCFSFYRIVCGIKRIEGESNRSQAQSPLNLLSLTGAQHFAKTTCPVGHMHKVRAPTLHHFASVTVASGVTLITDSLLSRLAFSGTHVSASPKRSAVSPADPGLCMPASSCLW